MTKSEILLAFSQIKSWSANGKRAPHKPLLILLALGELQKGNEQLAYNFVHEKLSDLLDEFGSSNEPRPYYPFVKLVNDGVWELDKPHLFPTYTQDYTPGLLKYNDVHGYFKLEIRKAMREDPSIIKATASYLLDYNFPSSLHEPILDAVGLALDKQTYERLKRDPKFREKILLAYNYQCAVCGFNVRMGSQHIGLEAAHIKWHTAGGPDSEVNGLALCSLHHKFLDLGAFKLSPELSISISPRINCLSGAEEWLFRYEGKSLLLPRIVKHYPEREYVAWHVEEVFKNN